MMSYRIPSEDLLERTIREVMKDQTMVVSQRRLTELVVARLREEDPDFTATGERIRRVTIGKGIAKVVIYARETEERTRFGRCPVCSSRMSRLRNLTVFGGSVTLGYKCTLCPYWTGLKRRVPVRYVFHGDDHKKAERASGTPQVQRRD